MTERSAKRSRLGIGIVGCGYVFDHYMATWGEHPRLDLRGVTDIDPGRVAAVQRFYGVHAYASIDEMLADPAVDVVLNLTSIESHVSVTTAALDAGKHVYSEKPVAMNLDEARRLFHRAEEQGLRLSVAPSNALGDTAQTLWKAVRNGAVGEPRIIYAEFDDNPIYLMQPESWRSRSGAPWPYRSEYEHGCTTEHIGYHLTVMCAIFGPVQRLTAFSALTEPNKTSEHLNPADTADFSIAALQFESGVVARVTCSIGAPLDHRLRIVGSEGVLEANTYRHYRCPVRLERFSGLTLNARKSYSVRTSSLLQRAIGIGGRRLRLVRNPPPGRTRGQTMRSERAAALRSPVRALKQREIGRQDKSLGVAELVDAVLEDRTAFPSHEFSLHLTELTHLVQGAGHSGVTTELSTSFVQPELRPGTHAFKSAQRRVRREPLFERAVDRMLVRLHQHR